MVEAVTYREILKNEDVYKNKIEGRNIGMVYEDNSSVESTIEGLCESNHSNLNEEICSIEKDDKENI